MKRTAIVAALLLFCALSQAQLCQIADFKDCIHRVDSLFQEHTRTYGCLYLSHIVRTGNRLDFHFGEGITFFPLRQPDIPWLKSTLKENLPEKYAKCSIGNIYYNRTPMEKFISAAPGNDGSVRKSVLSTKDRRGTALVTGSIGGNKGLQGRHIAMWNSHGYYYNIKKGCWTWQRPHMFHSVEDIYTLSYVLPLLVPMLENAGANVLIPRERDWHRSEIIIDNNENEVVSDRIHGSVHFSGKWKEVNKGFADNKSVYFDFDNPFSNGTSMQCTCGPKTEAEAVWSANVPERGEYAVYVSYVTQARSTCAAKYTIHAMGHDEIVSVNQQMGGGGWVYVGTFEFDKGPRKLVSLSSKSSAAGIVVADAVKIGGGTGNFARGQMTDNNHSTSGKPRFAEGARYFLQWSGVDDSVWSQNDGADDYRDDLMCRGKWVGYLAGGSWVNPKAKGRKIPIDLSFAFHTDAGTKPDSTIVGTLAIYTLLCENSSRLPSGLSRATSRELTDYVQTQVVDDIRKEWNPDWKRRMLWNKSYSESRTTSTPAILLELLSHMNFEDMKYGLDPAFRFTVARACYKGILKYLALHYGCPYAVQPLPVKGFSAKLCNDKRNPSVLLQWRAQDDESEPTAKAEYFIIYTRLNGQGWNSGQKITISPVGGTYSATLPIEYGNIYSYKIVAGNEGGVSFPSEILSVGTPHTYPESLGNVLVVNNFNRISGPVWFDTVSYAGFCNSQDSGVPYIRDISFTGEQFNFKRFEPFVDNDNVGFGASWSDCDDIIIAGNNFDYPYIHGKSIIAAGYSFNSCSSEAFCRDSLLRKDAFAIDLICGKECVVKTAFQSPLKFGIYSDGIMTALKSATSDGCNVIISGSYIASDAFGTIYQCKYPDRSKEQSFIQNTLGFSLMRQQASRTGEIKLWGAKDKSISFPVKPCSYSYCVESPDALRSFGLGSQIEMIYADTGLPAGIMSNKGQYKVAAYGFPIEIVREKADRDKIIAAALKYFKSKDCFIVSDSR